MDMLNCYLTSSVQYCASVVQKSVKIRRKKTKKNCTRTTLHHTISNVGTGRYYVIFVTHTLQSTNYGIIQFRHNAYRIMVMMTMMMTAIKQKRYKSNNKIRILKLKAKREHHDKYKRNNSNNNDNNNNHKFFIYSLPFISSRLVSKP